MRKWAAVPLWACVLLLAIGCERKKASEAHVEKYDPKVDAPPSVLAVSPSPDLLANQAEVSKRYERSGKAAPTAAAAAPGAKPEEQVKQLIAGVLEGLKAGKPEGVLALWGEDDAKLVQPFIAGTSEITTASAELQQAITDKLGIEAPPSVKASLGGQQAPDMTGPLGQASVDEFKFALSGQNVTVTSPDGQQQTFVPVNSQYKLVLSEKEKQVFPILQELVTAQKQYIDGIKKGIDEGTITAANLEQQAKDIADRTVMPVMAKLMQLAMSAGPAPEGATIPAEAEGTTAEVVAPGETAPGEAAPADVGGTTGEAVTPKGAALDESPGGTAQPGDGAAAGEDIGGAVSPIAKPSEDETP